VRARAPGVHRKLRTTWLGFARVAAVVCLMSCSPAKGPVVVIGVDGLEWDVALPLIRQGRMPTLEELMRRGSFGMLSTRAPAKSPVIWTTVVTGKNPSKHGILDFTRLEANGERVLYSSTDRRTKAVWNIFTDAGESSTVVGWWNTFPVEIISGVMVAQVNTLEELTYRKWIKPGDVAQGPGQVYPAAREDEFLEIVEEVGRELPQLVDSLYGDAAAGASEPDALKWETCRWSIRSDESVRRIALGLARARPFPDLFLVYLGATDIFGHHFWRYHQPEAFRHPPSAAQIEKFGDVLARTYEHADAVLGELIAAMPADATVFVISDHGMRAKHVDAHFNLDSDDRPEDESGGHGSGPPGVIVAAGPPVRRSNVSRPLHELTRADLPLIGDVADITPTLLALRGLPIGRDMDGSVLEILLKPQALDPSGPEFVATHDTPQWLAARGQRAEIEHPGHQERLEQLRSLGYLDESPGKAN
jgi:hypothetical protein